MNRGTFRASPPTIGDYTGISVGGSWAGNRGRTHVDELRLWGLSDGQRNWGPGGSRLINTNWATGTNLAFPNDLGSIINAISGTITVQNVGSPFNAVYNTAGKIVCAGGVTGATTVLENNTLVQNTSGLATSLLSLGTIIGGTDFVAVGAACTMAAGGLVDISSSPVFNVSGGGTLSATSITNYFANVQIASGVTCTNFTAFSMAGNINGDGGTITNAVGLSLPLLTIGGTYNASIRIGLGPTTFTASTGGAAIDLMPGTQTVNGSALTFGTNLVRATGTFQFAQSANSFGMAVPAYLWGPTFKNSTTVVANLGASTGFSATPNYQADGASISVNNTVSTRMYEANGQTSVINAGTLTAFTLTSYHSGFAVGASTTVTSLTHFGISAVSVTGTLTTEIGLDIPALTGATPIGVRLAGFANPLQMSMSTTGPTTANLTSNTNGVMTLYHGATNYYWLIAFNDAGTVRYKYLQLNGTGVTWVTGTTLPT